MIDNQYFNEDDFFLGEEEEDFYVPEDELMELKKHLKKNKNRFNRFKEKRLYVAG